MNTLSHVPPGFRFHPTDEELIDYYLRKKVTSKRIDLDVIKDVDLYKIEPWDLQELCRMGAEDQNDWYFFSHKDKKYPTSTRTNRATKEGFWKATGRDKAIYSRHGLIGMRKTLVFYKGRAPNGLKSDWIMHEYRLETSETGTPQEEGWVVCRVFKKRMTTTQKVGDFESPYWYDDQASFMPDFDSPKRVSDHAFASSSPHHHPCKQEVDQLQYTMFDDSFPQLPLPEITRRALAAPGGCDLSGTPPHFPRFLQSDMDSQLVDKSVDNQLMDWRAMEKYVASQLSIDRESNYSDAARFHLTEEATYASEWAENVAKAAGVGRRYTQNV